MDMDTCGSNRGTRQKWKVSSTIFTLVTHCTATGRRGCGIEGQRTREHSVQDFELVLSGPVRWWTVGLIS